MYNSHTGILPLHWNKNHHNINTGIKNDLTTTTNPYKQQQFNCEQCNMTYTGETGRKFSAKLEEHQTSRQRLKDDKSHFEKYFNHEQHTNNYTTPAISGIQHTKMKTI